MTTRLATHTAVFGLAYKFGAPVAGAIDVAMPVKAPVARRSWTGVHLGVALGARRTDAQWTTELLAGGFPSNADNEALIDSNAVRYGTYLGDDHQVGNFAAGIDGAFGDAVMRGGCTSACPASAAHCPPSATPPASPSH